MVEWCLWNTFHFRCRLFPGSRTWATNTRILAWLSERGRGWKRTSKSYWKARIKKNTLENSNCVMCIYRMRTVYWYWTMDNWSPHNLPFNWWCEIESLCTFSSRSKQWELSRLPWIWWKLFPISIILIFELYAVRLSLLIFDATLVLRFGFIRSDSLTKKNAKLNMLWGAIWTLNVDEIRFYA